MAARPSARSCFPPPLTVARPPAGWYIAFGIIATVAGCTTATAARNNTQAEIARLCASASALDDADQFEQARQVAEQALTLSQTRPGEDSRASLSPLKLLVPLYIDLGKWDGARDAAQRAVQLAEREYGTVHSETADAKRLLVQYYFRHGDMIDAAQMSQEVLSILVRVQSSPLDLSAAYGNVGAVYRTIGMYDEAHKYLYEGLQIMNNHKSEFTKLDISVLYNNLGDLSLNMGRYDEAEQNLREAQSVIREMPHNERQVVTTLTNFSALYRRMGANDLAGEVLDKALKLLGDNSLFPFERATVLNNRAKLYELVGDMRRAEDTHAAALSVRKGINPQHPDVVASLINLANLYLTAHKFEQAEPLYQQALALCQQIYRSPHPNFADVQLGLARYHRVVGNPVEAQRHLAAALTTLRSVYGADHPDIAHTLDTQALWELEDGSAEKALPLLREAFSIDEHTLLRVRIYATETRMAQFLEELQHRDEHVYSLLLSRPEDPTAQQLAMTSAILRKGRTLDETALNSRVSQQELRPEAHAKFERFKLLRSYLSALTFQGQGSLDLQEYQRRKTQLVQQLEQTEQELVVASATLRAKHQSLSPDDVVRQVAAQLPPNGALVEVVIAHPYFLTGTQRRLAWGAPHYLAMVLRSDQSITAADLGSVDAVDADVRRFRDTISLPPPSGKAATGKSEQTAAKLFQTVLGPIRPLLASRQDIFLSLEGDLQQVPFDALRDDGGDLIGRYRFTYLSSGRDLLRVQPTRNGPLSAVVFADPAFGDEQALKAQPSSLATSAFASRRFDRKSIMPLPGTAAEAQVIRSILPSATVYERQAATKANLLGVHAPTILHVATHGLYVSVGELAPDSSTGVRGITASLAISPSSAPLLHPLLGSALAMAGATATTSPSQPDSESADDALVTALEISGMDLWGTQLVVLSACNTGRGVIAPGQGVYGLRRAVLIAGAQTVIPSLWSVNDASTKELMTTFYHELFSGRAAVDAMRQAALAMRKKNPHPYFWAPFIVVGRSVPLAGLPLIHPGPRPTARPLMLLLLAICAAGALGLLKRYRHREPNPIA